MSDILKKGGEKVREWWPVFLRCSLYFLIACIPEFLKEVRDFWKQGHWPPPQINLLGFVEGGWAGFVAVRAFMDTFLKTHSDKLEVEHAEKKKDTAFFAASASHPAP